MFEFIFVPQHYFGLSNTENNSTFQNCKYFTNAAQYCPFILNYMELGWEQKVLHSHKKWKFLKIYKKTIFILSDYTINKGAITQYK